MNTISTHLFGIRKQSALCLLFLLGSLMSYAQVDWIKTTTPTDNGSFLSGAAQAHDMAIDVQDNIYVVGNYNGDAVFDDTTVLGTRDPIFLAKYNATGGVEWVNEIGGNSNNDGNTVAVNDSGHVYISGVFSQTNSNTILDFGTMTLAGDREENLFLAKADGAGTFLWAVAIIVDDLTGPDQNITPWDMLVDQQGSIYLTGKMLGSITIEGMAYNSNPQDVDQDMLFFAKFKPDGTLDWFRQSNSLSDPGSRAYGHKLTLASNGDVFLSGEYENMSYDGMTLPNISTEEPEKFIARFDPMGDLVWIHPMASRLADQQSFHIGVDQQDNVYTLLTRSSNIYFEDDSILFPYDYVSQHLLVKVDGNGNRVFLKETAYPNGIGSHGITEQNMVTKDDGTTFFTGNAIGFADYVVVGNDSIYLDDVPNSSFVATPFIAAFDANGNGLGIENFVDEHLNNLFEYDINTATMLTDHGKLFMTGFLNGDFRFGMDTITTDPFDQLFLTQIEPAFLNTTTSIERMPERLAFSIYPNPAQDRVHIELDVWQQTGEAEMLLFDLSGQLLQQIQLSSSSLDLELAGLASGFYFVMLKDERGIYTKKLQVE